jgi:secondary thiamine-phosphate synthase enzyme
VRSLSGPKQLIDVTDEAQKVGQASGVKSGFVYVMTVHASAGMLVTEGVECLERDILSCMERLAPEQGSYRHNRYLNFDYRLGFNAHAHLKSVIGGYFVYFPVVGDCLLKGSCQRIYFAEYDGPLTRTYFVQSVGE